VQHFCAVAAEHVVLIVMRFMHPMLLVHANANQPKTLAGINAQVYCRADDIYCVPPILLLAATILVTALQLFSEPPQQIRSEDKVCHPHEELH
jgi:hypothetical protein